MVTDRLKLFFSPQHTHSYFFKEDSENIVTKLEIVPLLYEVWKNVQKTL